MPFDHRLNYRYTVISAYWFSKNEAREVHKTSTYRGADKSLARPGRKQANVSVRMAWISFGALPRRKKNLTTRVSMLLKSRPSLTCFRACFLPGWAKDLPAPRCIRHFVFMYFRNEKTTAPNTVRLYLMSAYWVKHNYIGQQGKQ